MNNRCLREIFLTHVKHVLAWPHAIKRPAVTRPPITLTVPVRFFAFDV